MRNENTSLSARILAHVGSLPYCTIDNLKILGVSPYHLRIVLSRLSDRGDILRLKKGLYASKEYIDKVKMNDAYSTYLEFIATKIYEPSYISLEYVLYEHNVLTDVPINYTLITRNKTYNNTNDLGNFLYHKIKDDIFYGYCIKKTNDFVYGKASGAKALFDFLYLRRKLLMTAQMLNELRLNLDVYNRKDWIELRKYVIRTGSKKMNQIYHWLKQHD